MMVMFNGDIIGVSVDLDHGMLQQLENRKLELGRPVDKLATIVLERQASCIKPRRSMCGSDQRMLELGNV